MDFVISAFEFQFATVDLRFAKITAILGDVNLVD